MTEERACGSGPTTIGRVVQPKTPEALCAALTEVPCFSSVHGAFVCTLYCLYFNCWMVKQLKFITKSLKFKENNDGGWLFNPKEAELHVLLRGLRLFEPQVFRFP